MLPSCSVPIFDLFMKLTYEIINGAGSRAGHVGFCYNAYQLRLLGIGWPPRKGWVGRLIGKEADNAVIEAVYRLKGARSKQERKKLLAMLGISPDGLFQGNAAQAVPAQSTAHALPAGDDAGRISRTGSLAHK